ncbi:MAG: SAM-dependent methyltransferase [Bacteroidetes bacterium B1(2017)]|nr:MAG: SAM-dependent methyltransferase [Bacteroidetes bacterium B1(2017)]
MKERWNQRYQAEEFAYGILPNEFLREQLQHIKPGKILFAAEGEGRNAVYAAKLGWEVFAFDISEEGQKKALKLAEENGVSITYEVGEEQYLNYAPAQFDAIVFIYAHFPGPIKSGIQKQISTYLKPGGTILFEAFSKNHLAYVTKNEAVGGPKDLETLFSLDELKADFENYDYLQLQEQEIELHEGIYHNGLGSVVRMVGRKKA